MRGRKIAIWISSALAAAGAIALVVQLAARERQDPARCSGGLVAQGPRCCAAGQSVTEGGCAGVPASCPEGMRVVPHPVAGCAVIAQRVRLPGGRLRAAPSDWEGETAALERPLSVGPFALDATEVTNEQSRSGDGEPGLPRTNVTPEEAERICALAGGRLPRREEWLLAAAGNQEPRRFAWGHTGLVCRRAAFGLVDGPCAEGAVGPELAGARPDGQTPDGIHDLAGNVAEWTREPDGTFRARGGSFRSRVAGELKSWAAEPPPPGRRGPQIGFRCAYDVQ
jgi:formylglycine-generating enzyme